MSTNTPPDGLKSIGQPEHLPPLWWINPWRAAIQQAKASDIYRAWWLSVDKQLCATASHLAGRKLQADATEKVILDTANEAGFTESKYGYAIPGQPHSPFPLKWLGEAVAYWKSEAYAARKQRDEEIRKYCDAMKVIRNADEELSQVRGELSDAKADKAEADKHHAEEHEANIRLHMELGNLKAFAERCEMTARSLAAKVKTKRKPAKKKKGGRRA